MPLVIVFQLNTPVVIIRVGAEPCYFSCGSECAWERKFLGAKFPFMELPFLGAKERGNESSIILLS